MPTIKVPKPPASAADPGRQPFFARRLKSSRRCEASANRPHRRFANSHRHITRPARFSFRARVAPVQ